MTAITIVYKYYWRIQWIFANDIVTTQGLLDQAFYNAAINLSHTESIQDLNTSQSLFHFLAVKNNDSECRPKTQLSTYNININGVIHSLDPDFLRYQPRPAKTR